MIVAFTEKILKNHTRLDSNDPSHFLRNLLITIIRSPIVLKINSLIQILMQFLAFPNRIQLKAGTEDSE